MIQFADTDCTIEENHYANGRLRWDLCDAQTGEPVATATVNVPDYPSKKLDDRTHVLIKDWSENAGIVEALHEARYISLPQGRVPAGFAYAAVCRVTREVT
jgi:hypothetical protein